jgi:hypothetical protein
MIRRKSRATFSTLSTYFGLTAGKDDAAQQLVVEPRTVAADVSGSNFINCAQSISSRQMQTACSAIRSAPR